MQRRAVIISLTMLGLTGCVSGLGIEGTARPQMDRSYALRGFSFAALEGLSVSESETFYPDADIVWRGDPMGPRIPQIAAMFQEAAARTRPVVDDAVPVDVDVTLVRFHGVTNRTRYTVGGVYNVVFDLTIHRAGFDEVIEPARRVVDNLDAPGGERAGLLEQSGQTQKVRVTDFLTTLLRAQLV
ncbi:DUF6778 family protein [Yoonia sp.]|uniref:DUF6778 family protein n=1 Tax=Yoonia sp. TaxID=2212373 RepID=UPI00397600AA